MTEEENYNALKTRMINSYKDYLRAVEQLQHKDTKDMDARLKLSMLRSAAVQNNEAFSAFVYRKK